MKKSAADRYMSRITRWRWLKGRILWELTWWRKKSRGHPMSWERWKRAMIRFAPKKVLDELAGETE